MTRQATQYVALSSEDGGATWFVVLVGERSEGKQSVEDRAERSICGDQCDQAKDIYADTQLKNLVTLPLSSARRRYGMALETYYQQTYYQQTY